MKLSPETCALITGAGGGIGRALALALGARGVCITVVELSEADGGETVRLLHEQREREGGGAMGAAGVRPHTPPAQFVRTDVADPQQLAAAFQAHITTYGRLDLCINNAGIGSAELLDDASTDGSGAWRRMLAINLVAVLDGTRLAVHTMRSHNGATGGLIINVASAAGIFPTPGLPAYAATKGGVVQLTRSLADLYPRFGIRVCAFCPQYIDTNILRQGMAHKRDVVERHMAAAGGLIPMDTAVEAVLELIGDESSFGDGGIMRLSLRSGRDYWNPRNYRAMKEASKRKGEGEGDAVVVAPNLPQTYSRMIVHTLSSNFRLATRIIAEPLLLPPPPGCVLIRQLYAGVNASDVNFSAGRYSASKEAAQKSLPFDAGFEAVGTIAATGEGVKGIRLGTPAANFGGGGFSEYRQLPARHLIPVPESSPAMVALLTSGLTASIGLEQAGRMGSDETVLVTAAAGGTGQFVVQLAKLAGNRVVATCGGQEKSELLRRLGADRVIDYRKEDVGKVLKAEFPQGVDLVFESVGGRMFTTCVNALAQGGRLIVIGMMSQYLADATKGWVLSEQRGLPEKLLNKSLTLVGFLVLHYAKEYKRHLAKLHSLYKAGLLKVNVDPSQFVGLEAVPDAVEHLHSGKSMGKVVVRLTADEHIPLRHMARM